MLRTLITFIPDRTERGQAVSLFVILVMAAVIMATGLVIDGGQKVTAATTAEGVAASAARSASNAAAADEVSGRANVGAAVLAAKTYLAGATNVTGSVLITDGIVTVSTRSSQPTLFLSLIGIDTVTAHGHAQTNIVPTGESR